MKGKKTGGRKKGTPNKITTDVRQWYREFITERFDDFVSAWEGIDDPKDKAEVYIKATKFVVPALQSVDMNATVENDISVEQILREMAQENETI